MNPDLERLLVLDRKYVILGDELTWEEREQLKSQLEKQLQITDEFKKCKQYWFDKHEKLQKVIDGHSCLRHYTCRSCGHVHVRKGK